MTLTAAGRSAEDAARFQALFTAARSADWAEFLADCGKFEAELAKEIRTAKFTLAELLQSREQECARTDPAARVRVVVEEARSRPGPRTRAARIRSRRAGDRRRTRRCAGPGRGPRWCGRSPVPR